MEIFMSVPTVALKSPTSTEVEGKSYFLCNCVKRSKQPLCDGSHKETYFTTLRYTAARSDKVSFADARTVRREHYLMGATRRFNPQQTTDNEKVAYLSYYKNP